MAVYASVSSISNLEVDNDTVYSSQFDYLFMGVTMRGEGYGVC